MEFNKIIFGFFIVLMVAAIGCSSSQPLPEKGSPDSQGNINAASGKLVAVDIENFKFVPSAANIKVGDTVVWTNKDSAAHTVESSDGTLKSDELSEGDTYRFTFAKPGAYNYICGIHPSMKGSVTVQ